MVLQIWRHRPSGEHFAVYVRDGQAVSARGPMNPKEAAALTSGGFDEASGDEGLADRLNAAPWEYDPVWESEAHQEEDAEWLKAIMEPGDDGLV